MEKHIGSEIRCLANRIRRETEGLPAILRLDELSGTNGYIIVYISQSTEAVYQRDLEREFGITRSTASRVLSLMKKKGLIERRSVSGDKRLKEIVLTEKAAELGENVRLELAAFERKLLKDFTSEEAEALSSFLNRIGKNLFTEGDKND